MQQPDVSFTNALILGGARSGKSSRARELADDLAKAAGLQRIFIATARPGDAEMAERIARHREERERGWVTVEEPLDLPGAIKSHAAGRSIIVIDCLTFWLANLMFDGVEPAPEMGRLIHELSGVACPCILVSNEVGSGIVPANQMAREFRDLQGRLNQRVARAVDRVELVVAGLPLRIKP